MKYNWKGINDRLVAAIRPSSSAVALKYVKTEEELAGIPNVKFWSKPGTTVCTVIGVAAYWNVTVALRSEKADLYCGKTNGILTRDQDWHDGVYLNSDPIKWHGQRADSRQHANLMLPDLPADDHIAVVVSPIVSGDIEDPDAIILSSDPGAAFHLLAAFVEKDNHKIDFPFRGESTCADTWNHTAVTGLPGVSLGCRGDRCCGALGNGEVRYSMTTEDLLKALDGVDRLKSDGIEYPYYPDGVLDLENL